MRAIKLKFLLTLIVMAGVAQATPVLDFKLVISGVSIGAINGNFDTPVASLTNTTTGGIARISSFTLTIGDTSKNFDFISGQAGGVTGPLTYTPDTAQANLRADSVSVTFSNFDPNETLVVKFDIDDDALPNSQPLLDFRTVLFNNGPAENAKISVNFIPSGSNPDNTISGPVTKSFFLKDMPAGQDTYEFIPATAVPEPGTLLTFAAGVAAILASRMRRS